jgi:hypothetical protein
MMAASVAQTCKSVKTITTVSLTGLAAGLLMLAGCATPITHETPLTKEQLLEEPDVKGQPPAVFPNDLETVRKAGLRALNFAGCQVVAQEPLYLAGARPQKFGFLVNSGGERVKIFLYPEAEKETRVWVDTDTAFTFGQQGWNQQVLTQMTNLLSSPLMGGVQ